MSSWSSCSPSRLCCDGTGKSEPMTVANTNNCWAFLHKALCSNTAKSVRVPKGCQLQPPTGWSLCQERGLGGPFIYLVIIQQWVFYAFLEMESGAKRARQTLLGAETARVAWLGLSGTTAVFLGAACPALALAGTRYEKK